MVLAKRLNAIKMERYMFRIIGCPIWISSGQCNICHFSMFHYMPIRNHFNNISKNDTYKVEIRRNKDNTLIADAFELAAGKSISTLTLLEAPEFGNVDCTVTITAFRDGKRIGTLNTELTLHTAYLWPKEVR